MKHFLIVVAALALSFSLGAHAQTPQQTLMASCTDMKGDERKAFMKTCLSDGKKQSQERMKTCNVEVEGKTGDARKVFLSECLKK